jgi:hypothetical protein
MWIDYAVLMIHSSTGRIMTSLLHDVPRSKDLRLEKVGIPSGTGSDAKHAFWHIDGTLRIHTRTHDGS